MIKIVVITLLLSFAVATTPAYANTSSLQSVELMAKILELQKQIQVLLTKLQAAKTVETKIGPNCTNTKKPNLFIGSVSFDNDVLSGNSIGVQLPDQEIKVKVMSEGCVSDASVGMKVHYSAVVYERVSGTDPKVETTTGYFTLGADPENAGNFSLIVTGGLPYEMGEFEREYYTVIKIDSKNRVKESKENDNSLTSGDWVMEYYKG